MAIASIVLGVLMLYPLAATVTIAARVYEWAPLVGVAVAAVVFLGRGILLLKRARRPELDPAEALIRGAPDAAEWIRSSLAHAEAIRSPFNICYARDLAGQYWASAGDRERALEHATSVVAVAGEHGFVVHEGAATVVRGWASRDVTIVRDGIAQYEGADAYVALSFFRGLLVEVLLDLGDVDTARSELARAFDFVERTGEQRHLPELYRLQGECLRREGASPRAFYDRVLTLARQQGARLWELRATISAAELVGADGLPEDARAMLQAALAPFADGCDLPDVRRARALRAGL